MEDSTHRLIINIYYKVYITGKNHHNAKTPSLYLYFFVWFCFLLFVRFVINTFN